MDELRNLEMDLENVNAAIKKLKFENKVLFVSQIGISMTISIFGLPLVILWQRKKRKNLEKIIGFEIDNRLISNKIVVAKRELEQIVNRPNKAKERINNSIAKSELDVRQIRQSELYLTLFSNVEKYDLSKELSDNFLSKIRQTKEVDYDKFMKKGMARDQPDSFVVFDLETTGLSPEYNEIIEIGAIRFVDDIPTEIFHALVKPKKKITQKITSLTGITNEMLSEAKCIEEIIPFFLDFIRGDVLVAHNASFDISFILENLYNLGYKKLNNKVIDTLALSRRYVREYDYFDECDKKLQNYKLVTLKNEFGLSELSSHNSIDDCKVCAYVYQRIKDMHGDICFVGDSFVDVEKHLLESATGS